MRSEGMVPIGSSLAPILFLVAAGLFAAHAMGQMVPGGSGPHPAIIGGDPGIPGHTIYRPENLNPFSKENPLPVVAWGNGGCANSSRMHANFLLEIASQGFLVIAIGPFQTTEEASGKAGGTRSAQLLEAHDWASTEAARRGSPYYAKMNPAQFAVAGMSCGGLQALEVSTDPRVKTSVIMNSGILNAPMPPSKMPMTMPAVGKDLLKRLHAPVFYIIGGEKDIAYPNAVDDFAQIESVPVAMANLDVGHGGTYDQPNGGEFGRVAGAWLKWKLKGDEAAGEMFRGASCGLCRDGNWRFETKRIP